jgi:hypothetical protein
MNAIEYAGPVVTLSVGESPPYTVVCDEAARMRAVLLRVRPTWHDHLCEHGPDSEDVWVDQTDEDRFAGPGTLWEWEEGVGYVCKGEALPSKPYVGWCCWSATQRQAIDEALGIWPANLPPAQKG